MDERTTNDDINDDIVEGMMKTRVKILTGEPVVAPIAQMELLPEGVGELIQWVRERRPECLPAERLATGDYRNMMSLFPHDGVGVSHNELLVELAGRKCYDSFGLKAGKKSNREYIANTQSGDVPHASIMYHAKMSFFIAGVSRRVSHELIRHYVGADRTEEGSPSQESTRYVEHSGCYVAHPAILDNAAELDCFRSAMSRNYAEYGGYIRRSTEAYQRDHDGALPKGIDRKRIFESASPYLSHACETSFVWTTNPIALAKMFRERDHEAADLEYLRLARKWKRVCLEHWPSLFPQPWMRSAG